MRYTITLILCLLLNGFILAQQKNATSLPSVNQQNTDNIYKIKADYLSYMLHNPAEKDEDGNDNELTRFNRWYSMVAPRCYPSGNMPRPDVLLNEFLKAKTKSQVNNARTMSTIGNWTPIGPTSVPANFYGIGRVNVVVIDPIDTATLYVGTACGGVFISHDAGATWFSNTDNFPSLSIADIAVNPHHTDTIYAATGDGYGFNFRPRNMFWGGLYSAGIMMSIDGGFSWNPTSFSFLQTDDQIIQKLLIHPNQPNILLAATRSGIFRTTDAGITWNNVYGTHVISMVFHPDKPDTIYAVDTSNLLISYDAGATWNIRYAGVNINLFGGGSSGLDMMYARSTLAVSPIAPNDVWILQYNDTVLQSHNEGQTFVNRGVVTTSGGFYSQNYYDRVFVVSPVDSNLLTIGGGYLYRSFNDGSLWNNLDPMYSVHPDHHAMVYNPRNVNTIYDANDGGVVVSYDGGNNWNNISNGLMISQIYWESSSTASPYLMLCGLQDNGTFYDNAAMGGWMEVTGGDGMACAIAPTNDFIQVASYQYGNFYLSTDQGVTFNGLSGLSGIGGSWTSPVLFDPHNENTIYFGLHDVYVTYDQGFTFTNLTNSAPFTDGQPTGAITMAICNHNTNAMYAADFSHLLRTLDGGTTWTNVTAGLPIDVAIMNVAVDTRNPMLVYVTTSGYNASEKVYVSTTGGLTWSNISTGLPNLPVNCITVDSAVSGALFVGTDMGVYYTDSTMTGWHVYAPGLPNVIIDHIEINYANLKVRAATYGRGMWECNVLDPLAVAKVTGNSALHLSVTPNPSKDFWNITFTGQKPEKYEVSLIDVSGKVLLKQTNTSRIDATKLVSGIYDIEVRVDKEQYCIKAVKE